MLNIISSRLYKLIAFVLIISQCLFAVPVNIFADMIADGESIIDEEIDVPYEEILEKFNELDATFVEETENNDDGIVVEEIKPDKPAFDRIFMADSEELSGAEEPDEVSVSMDSLSVVLDNTGKDFRKDADPIGKVLLPSVKKDVKSDNTYSDAVPKQEVRVPRYVIIHSDVTSLSENETKTATMKYVTELFVQGKPIPKAQFVDGAGNYVEGAYEEFMSNLRIYDYTEGYPISEEGYLMENGEVLYNKPADVSGNAYPTYLGYRFEINQIDENTFKAEGAEIVNKIKIPMSIVTDIDYTFFEKCTANQRIEVYFQNDDIPNVNYSPKYLSSAKTDLTNTAERYGGDDTGVLLKKRSFTLTAEGKPSDCLEYDVVYCPPKYNKAYYCFPFMNGSYGTKYYIADHAFENCKGLEKIGWRDAVSSKSSVIRIGDYAFSNCVGLKDVEIFDKYLQYIGNYAFSGCKNLGSKPNPTNPYYDHTINLGIDKYGSNTVIGKRAFYGTVIKSLRIPSGYRTISGESLYGMDELEEITIDDPGNPEDMNPYFEAIDGVLYRKGFSDAQRRQLVCFPAKKTINNSDEEIAKLKGLPYSDDYKDSIEDATFMVPFYVTEIDDYAFSNCINLENLILLSTLYSIEPHSITGCGSLVNLYSHSGLPDMDYSTNNSYLEGCSSSKINLSIHAPKYFASTIKKGLYNFAKDNGYSAGLTMLFDINSFTIEAGVLKKYNAKEGDPDFVKDVFVPDFVIVDGEKVYTIEVSDGAFTECTEITSVTILNHLEYMPSGAFIRYDDAPDTDTYPKELVEIYVEDGNKNFMTEGGALYKVNPDNGDVEELIFYPPSNKSKIFIAAKTLKRLPRYAFRGAKNLEVVKIYDSIEQIGYYKDSEGNEYCDEPSVFDGCINLYEVDILENPDTLIIRYASSDGVLYRWSATDHALVYFPKGERYWPINGHNGGVYSVLDGCEVIRDVKNVKGLNAIYIPKSVERILKGAFEGSDHLKDVYFKMTGEGKGLKVIEDKAFSGCALSSLTLPYTLQSIGEEAFTENSLRHLVIYSDNLTLIGKRAFANQTVLETVELIPYSDDSRGKVLTIDDGAFRDDICLKTFETKIADRLNIGSNAFTNNTSLQSFKMGQFPVTSLGERCFLNCSKLKSIDLSYYKGAYSLVSIPTDAFSGCKSLTEVTLPKSITDIETRAFYECKSLEFINFYDLLSLKNIGKQAFMDCDFKQVNFTKNSSLVYLGEQFMDKNNNLTAIYIPASVVYFGANNTFENLTTKTIVYTTKGSAVAKYIINDINASLGLKDAAEYNDPLTEIEYDTYEDYRGPKVAYGDILKYKVIVTTDDSTPFFKQSVGAKRQFSASVINVGGDQMPSQEVRWKSLDPDVISVDDNGLVTLLKSDYVGIVYVEAVSVLTGDFGKCGIEIVDASIFINGQVTDNAYVIVNAKGKNRISNINATINPTRNLYYKIVSGKNNIKVSPDGKITGLKRGSARVRVFAKEGDGSAYSTYMETYVNVIVVNPSIKTNQKSVTLYGDHSTVKPVDYTKDRDLYGAYASIEAAMTPEEIAIADYTHKRVSVTCESVGPTADDKRNYVDNHVLWTLPGTDSAYMIDDKGHEVSELTSLVGGDGNIPNVASVEVYASSNVNKTVKLKATYNGITTTIPVRIKKISTSMRPVAIDIYNFGKNARIKTKIVGPDTKNIKWSFFNEDATVSEYISSIDKKGNVLLGPNIFAKNHREKVVYAYLTANGVTSEPCEIHIKETKTTIEPEEMDIITVDNKDYIFLNSKGNNSIKLRCSIEGPDLKQVKWQSGDKTIFTTKGSNGQAIIKGKDSGKSNVIATANGVTTNYPVMVVNTYTEFTSGDGIVLDLEREYKPSDNGNKLMVRINGTDKDATIIWKSENPEVCRIGAIDTGIEGEKLSTYKISQGGDYGYKRAGKVELIPLKKGSCYITAQANGVIAKYKIKVE